jgi:hypothetical protein
MPTIHSPSLQAGLLHLSTGMTVFADFSLGFQ